MNTENIEKVKFAEITQSIRSIIRNHAAGNEALEKDLIQLLEMTYEEQRKLTVLKTLAFELANKLA